MKNKKELDILIEKYLNRQCSVDEINKLMHEFGRPQNKEALKAALLHYFENSSTAPDSIDEADTDASLKEVHLNLITQIRETNVGRRPPYRLMWARIAAAAAILIFISAGSWFYLTRVHLKSQASQLSVNQPENDVLPGGNRAILILSNGKKIVLNNAKDGVIARQNGMSAIKTKNGQLVNKVDDNSQLADGRVTEYNTITTLRGGQYQVILPDGTKVWLNAASSLKYPTEFKGKERNVELTGEAYFEVAKNAAMPFHVRSAGQTVEVLGTHFNISAYQDEGVIKTTLLEGSIQITYQQTKVLIKPGEQARVIAGSSNKIIVDENADTDEAVAWKDGYFQFNHADIRTVMRQISRWYDVKVRYEGSVSSKDFGGAIERNLKLSQVLHILEKSQVHFVINGKEVVVMQ